MLRFEDYNDMRQLILISVQTNRGQWWATDSLGSDVFLLGKGAARLDPDRLKTALAEAVGWLTDQKLAKTIDISTSLRGYNAIAWTMVVTKPSESSLSIQELHHVI